MCIINFSEDIISFPRTIMRSEWSESLLAQSSKLLPFLWNCGSWWCQCSYTSMAATSSSGSFLAASVPLSSNSGTISSYPLTDADIEVGQLRKANRHQEETGKIIYPPQFSKWWKSVNSWTKSSIYFPLSSNGCTCEFWVTPLLRNGGWLYQHTCKYTHVGV